MHRDTAKGRMGNFLSEIWSAWKFPEFSGDARQDAKSTGKDWN